MGQSIRGKPLGGTSRVKFRIDSQLANGAKDLSQTTNDDLSEEEGEEHLDGQESHQAKSRVVPVHRNLYGQLPPGRSECNNNENQCQTDQDAVLQVNRSRIRFHLATLLV